MSKRFTDTDKWKKGFIKSLEAPYKLLWLYIIDDCNHAGIWDVDLDVAALRIGLPLDKAKALAQLGKHVVTIDGGEKWYIPAFVEFQYGELNPQNRAHQSVIQLLRKHKMEAPCKPLTTPSEGCKDMDKDMVPDSELVGVLRGRLSKVYHRRPTTPWDKKEMAALRVIAKRPEVEAECAEIEAAHVAGVQFLRQAVAQLLNNWQTELDRIRNPQGGKPQSPAGNDDEFVRLGGIIR